MIYAVLITDWHRSTLAWFSKELMLISSRPTFWYSCKILYNSCNCFPFFRSKTESSWNKRAAIRGIPYEKKEFWLNVDVWLKTTNKSHHKLPAIFTKDLYRESTSSNASAYTPPSINAPGDLYKLTFSWLTLSSISNFSSKLNIAHKVPSSGHSLK